MIAADGMLTPRPTLSARVSPPPESELALEEGESWVGVESAGVVPEAVALETVVLVELVDVVELVAEEIKIPLLSRNTFATWSLLQHGVSPLRQQ